MLYKSSGNLLPDTATDDLRKQFQKALNKTLGEQIRADDNIAHMAWTAIAHNDWQHAHGGTVSFSLKAAAILITAIRGEGDYTDWYCTTPDYMPEGHVDPIVAIALAERGWYAQQLKPYTAPKYKHTG